MCWICYTPVGTIAFIGKIAEKSEVTWVGCILDNKVGVTMKKKRLFDCPPKRAYLTNTPLSLQLLSGMRFILNVNIEE